MKVSSIPRAPVSPLRAASSSATAEPKDSRGPSRLEGAAVGFAKGFQVGMLLDVLLLGIPIFLGYGLAGAKGAIVAGLLPPVGCGVFGALGGFAHPESMVKES